MNLASRLEGITKTYGVDIVISEFTYEDIKDTFVTRELDSVAVKGKEFGVKIYELICARDGADFFDLEMPFKLTATPKEKPILGRLDEFNKALTMYRDQQFAEAIPIFESLAADENVHDYTSKLYIGRCKEYIDDPPPKNWDGVYRPKTK